MKIIWIASKNRAKIDGTFQAFSRLYRDEQFTVVVKSVSNSTSIEQPRTEEETILGAQTRLMLLMIAAENVVETPDFFVSIEAGVTEIANNIIAFSWATVASRNKQIAYGRSETFTVPPRIAKEIKNGYTMLEASKMAYPHHSDLNRENGLISLLSEGIISRTDQSATAVTMALLGIKNPQFYQD